MNSTNNRIDPPGPARLADQFWELEAEVPRESEEVWGAFCYEQGATGAMELAGGPGAVHVVHYFDRPPSDRPAAFAEAFASRHPRAEPPRDVRLRNRPREDWATAWRAHFSPIPVADRFLVCPPWDTGGDEPKWRDRLRIVIDPGQGFGTGRHPTTALMLSALPDILAREQPSWLVDVGSGSGILTLGSRLLGASRVLALEIDGAAVPDGPRNARHTGVEGGMFWVHGGVEAVGRPAPLVLANLELPILTRIVRPLVDAIAPGGLLLVSGVLASERETLEGVYTGAGMREERVSEREGWIAVHWRRDA